MGNTETHRTYHENGKLKEEIELANGERNGISKYYYETGELLYKEQYVDGKEHGITQQELINFRNSMHTTFMNWYYYNIVVPGNNKLHMSMFVMNDYKEPWTDDRFYDYFNLTEDEIHEIRAIEKV